MLSVRRCLTCFPSKPSDLSIVVILNTVEKKEAHKTRMNSSNRWLLQKKYSSCYFRGDLGKSMYGYVGIVMVCNPTHAQPDYNNNLHYPKTVQTTIALHMQGAATGSGRLYASHAPRVEWPWWRRGECAWSGRGCAETAYSGEPRTSSEQHYADLLNRD